MSKHYILLLTFFIVSCGEKISVVGSAEPASVLVLTETQGYRHLSIDAGIGMFRKNAEEWGLSVMYSDESRLLVTGEIGQYTFIVLLSTTGDFLDDDEQSILREYVENGGGVLGIHAATDAEYQWDWYGDMLGARFNGHPAIQEAKCVKEHDMFNSGIPSEWIKTDEWYNFSNVSAGNTTLISIDEQSYDGGTMGAFHPVSWYRQVAKGRVFYTAMGHTSETYSEPVFVRHIGNAVRYLTE